MSDDFGILRLKYPSAGYEFSFGTVTGISDSFMKSASTTPIPSLPAANAFTVESKTSKTITVSFVRKNPPNAVNSGSDTRLWSNGYWITMLKAAIDRWQCRTDGFTLTYEPAEDNPYISPINEEGYIKNFSVNFTKAIPEKIKGSFEFHVGGMHIKSLASAPAHTEPVLQEQFKVIIYNSTNTAQNELMSGSKDVSCIESMSIRGGPEAPFEYVTMKIPRKKLLQIAPNLFKRQNNYPVCDIVAGKNRLELTIGGGSSSMTVSKVKLSSNTYTITAYCNAERIRGTVLAGDESAKPSQWVSAILKDSRFGLGFADSSIISNYSTKNDADMGEITFKDGTNVWYILQVAAMCLGARVFFANNKAYVVDYTLGGSIPQNYGTVDLYPSSRYDMYYGSVIGSVDLGDEGVDTILNVVSIGCSSPRVKDGNYETDSSGMILDSATYTYKDEDSIKAFENKEYAGNTIYIPELLQTVGDVNTSGGTPKDPEETDLLLDLSSVSTTFYVGSKFDYSNLKVSVLEEDGTETDVDLKDCTVSSPDMSTPGEKKVTVTYNGKSAAYYIIVKQIAYSQAKAFAESYVKYRTEPQQSISFTLREMRNTGGKQSWHPFFGPASVANKIIDDVDDTLVDNTSVVTNDHKFEKLALSTYERQYPSGKTTYNWGVLNTIDLSSSTSQITTGLSNVKT